MIRQAKPSKRWKTPGVPEYDRNWIVRFSIPGQDRLMKSAGGLYPVCAQCAKCAGDPTEQRPNCANPGCQKDAAKWAKVELSRMLADQREGQLDNDSKETIRHEETFSFDLVPEVKFLGLRLTVDLPTTMDGERARTVRDQVKTHLRAVAKLLQTELPRATKQRLKMAEVIPVYLKHGPEGRRDENLAALRFVIEAPNGRPLEDWHVDEFTSWQLLLFTSFYQEYAARWLQPGMKRDRQLREQRWAMLRAERKDLLAIDPRKITPDQMDAVAKLLKIDRRTPSPANTTILSEIAGARAVLGAESRAQALYCFAGQWPDLRDWEEFSAGIPKPDNTFQLSPEVYQRMHDELPRLKREPTLPVWTALRIMWQTGIRPCELVAIQSHWLEVTPDGQVCIVVKNREGEFTMKNERTKRERVLPIDEETVEGIRAIMKPGCPSILGLRDDAEGEALLKRTSQWLRECGVTTTHTNYNLRKLVASVEVRRDGVTAAANRLGHHDGGMVTMKAYAGNIGVQRAITATELSPESVMGGRRTPWTAE